MHLAMLMCSLLAALTVAMPISGTCPRYASFNEADGREDVNMDLDLKRSELGKEHAESTAENFRRGPNIERPEPVASWL